MPDNTNELLKGRPNHCSPKLQREAAAATSEFHVRQARSAESTRATRTDSLRLAHLIRDHPTLAWREAAWSPPQFVGGKARGKSRPPVMMSVFGEQSDERQSDGWALLTCRSESEASENV